MTHAAVKVLLAESLRNVFVTQTHQKDATALQTLCETTTQNLVNSL
jgi:hypothetical protein